MSAIAYLSREKPPVPTEVSCMQRFGRWLAGLTRGRWLLLAFVACATIPSFFSWPKYPLEPKALAYWETYWDKVVELKIVNPQFNYMRAFDPLSNEAKRNYRLAVPLLARVSGMGLRGVTLVRFSLHAVLLLALVLAAERVVRDRLTALALSLTVAGTYVGTSVYRDICRWFDNCAHAFIAVALAARSPWLVGGAIFLGLLTDERVLLAAPLVILFHVFTRSPRRTYWGIAGGLAFSVLVRATFASQLGFLPAVGGVGQHSILVDNLTVAPLGYWFALEGGWLLLVCATWQARGKEPLVLVAALLVSTIVPVLAGTAVTDFTRSGSYLFGATFCGAALLARQSDNDEGRLLRRVALISCAASLVLPNVQIMQSMLVEQSLPAYALRSWLRTHP